MSNGSRHPRRVERNSIKVAAACPILSADWFDKGLGSVCDVRSVSGCLRNCEIVRACAAPLLIGGRTLRAVRDDRFGRGSEQVLVRIRNTPRCHPEVGAAGGGISRSKLGPFLAGGVIHHPGGDPSPSRLRRAVRDDRLGVCPEQVLAQARQHTALSSRVRNRIQRECARAMAHARVKRCCNGPGGPRAALFIRRRYCLRSGSRRRCNQCWS
jgi:hypothetical protein